MWSWWMWVKITSVISSGERFSFSKALTVPMKSYIVQPGMVSHPASTKIRLSSVLIRKLLNNILKNLSFDPFGFTKVSGISP